MTKREVEKLKSSIISRIREIEVMSPPERLASLYQQFPSMRFEGTDLEVFSMLVRLAVQQA